jgi:hypothetical protein
MVLRARAVSLRRGLVVMVAFRVVVVSERMRVKGEKFG